MTFVMSSPTYNPALHRIALLTCIATFPLIFIGGLVTSHGAGMAVPDWPNSYGYNMFLFPPSKWIGNIWYEHVHRLYASFIGMLSIVLCAWAWKTESRKNVRWLATAVLGAVIFQGVLGGLRVVLVKLDLAIIHACFAQAFFCLTALVVLVTSKWWIEAPALGSSGDLDKARRVTRLAIATVAVVYLQLIAGALMRHYQAGLAIPDFPLAYGHLIPPTTDFEIDALSMRGEYVIDGPKPVLPSYAAPHSLYGMWLHQWPGRGVSFDPSVTVLKVWLHFAHRLGAALVSAFVVLLALSIWRTASLRMRPLAAVLVALLVLQIGLGAFTVLLSKPADIASLHVAVGALVLVTSFVVAARTARLCRVRVQAPVCRAFEVVVPNSSLPLVAASA
jgi:cytochrome c oxidase assembly protein subunit 15